LRKSFDCIVLAAGKSERMEEWKMLLPFEGKNIIECSVEKALSVCSRVILVAGYRAEDLIEIFGNNKRVQIVKNPRFERGMFSSIKCGASCIETDRFFIALGDQPFIPPKVYRKLTEYDQIDVVIPKYKGKKGHPIFLSRRVCQTILEMDDRKTLRDVLALYPTLAVPVDEQTVIKDIDSPEDYKSSR